MPWKMSPKLLGNNRDVAIKAHQNVKTKAHKDKEHPPMVKQAFQSMLDNSFIIKTASLPPGNGISDGLRNHIENNPKRHYTVNTVVYKPSSTSTKTRITWDGSRKTSKHSPTINSLLMSGNPQYSLTKMILNWKLKTFALSTDISKFFNRIKVDPADRPFLNILWTESFDPKDTPEAFTMLSHTFGYISTSGVAMASTDILQDIARAKNMQELARALSYIYVDDINASTWTWSGLLKLKSELTHLLESHGFPLKGWALSGHPPDSKLSEHQYTAVGGWLWFSEKDRIQLAVPPIFLGDKKKGAFQKNAIFLHPNPSLKDISEFYKNTVITLPHIVSRTAMLFDLSGMSTPLSVLGSFVSRKALLDTKGSKTTQVSEQTKKLFFTYLHLVSKFGSLSFPRNMKRASQHEKSTLLAFADSSSTAWMVIIYLLRIDSKKQFFTEFFYSVAGLNPSGRTIPRNELNSYSKAAEAVDSISDVVKDIIDSKYLIADNKIAFHWTLNRAKKASLFVQNRVFKVISTFQDDQLLWVPSHSNPADIGTRPALLESQFTHLSEGEFFRTGPQFLSLGIQRAIKDKHLIPILNIKDQVEREIMDTILDLDPNGSNNIDHNSFDIVHPKQNTLDSVMVINFSDPQFLSKVEQVSEFSQYLICPLKRNYRTFHRSLTVTFRAIHRFLTPTKPRTHSQWEVARNLLKIRDKLLVPVDDAIFSPTITHLLPDNVNEVHHLHPTIHDIDPLHHYKPHIPQDSHSRNNLLRWLKYPGILKLVQYARKFHSEIANPPSKESLDTIRVLLKKLTYNSAVLASSPAGPLACSIVISAMLSGLHSDRVNTVQPVLHNYLNKPRPGNGQTKPVLSIVHSLVTSKDNWPSPPTVSISQLFDAQTIQSFTRITDNYLNSTSSKEVEHFIPKKILDKIATKLNGIWCAKNRALSQHSQLKRDKINPTLRFNKSPLTIALVKYAHSIHDNTFGNRPTSMTHTGWKENQFKFHRFGIIYQGAQLFKQVEQNCIKCEQRKQRKFHVHMGLANDCIFSNIRLFKYIAVDLKGPFLLPSNKSVHILVLICLQTKFCETVLLENRSASTILEAFNVAFTLLSIPTRITADREGGFVKISNVIQQLNDGLLTNFDVSLEFIPPNSHHMSGLIERKIKQISVLIGTLDLSTSNFSVIKFSNTLRIITHHLNSIPYLLQFVGGTDKDATSGLNEFPLEIQFISPISWFNPTLENCFNPLFVPSINQAQQHLLNKLNLLNKTYTEELIPKILLTLDRKRLTESDSVVPGQMVLIHTDDARVKHSKAILAQVVKANPGRDNKVRIVTIRYFKANSCKIVNNKLRGTATYITRGLETLSKLNQATLQQCKVTEYLHRHCKLDHSLQEPQNIHCPPQHYSDGEPPDPYSPLSVKDLDPHESTVVWIRDSEPPQGPSLDPPHQVTRQQADLSQERDSPVISEQAEDTHPPLGPAQNSKSPVRGNDTLGESDHPPQADVALTDPELNGSNPDRATPEQVSADPIVSGHQDPQQGDHLDLEHVDDPANDPDYQDPDPGDQPNLQPRRTTRTHIPKVFKDHIQ